MASEATKLRAGPGGQVISSLGRHDASSLAGPIASGPPLGSLAFACICVAVPLVTLNALRLTYSISIGDFLLVLGGAFAVAPRIRRGLLAGSVPSWLLGGGAGLVIAGLLAAFRGHAGQDLLPTLEFAGTLVGMPLIVMLAVDSYRRLELVVEFWLLGVSVSAAVAVVDLKLGTGIGYHLTGIDYVGETNRATGLTLQPNHLGLTAGMAMPVAALRASRRIRPVGFAISNARNAFYLVVLGAGVLASGSRSGLAAAVAGVVILPIFQSRRGRSPALTVTAMAIVLALAALTFDTSIASKLGVVTGARLSGQAAGTQDSNQARLATYGAAIRATAADPIFGQGFQSVRTAHDIYLQLLQAGGVVAFAAFLWFSSGMLRAARRLADRPDLPASAAGLAAAFGASFTAWLINGLVTNGLYDRYLYIPVGLLLATRLIAREQSARAAVDTHRRLDTGFVPA